MSLTGSGSAMTSAASPNAYPAYDSGPFGVHTIPGFFYMVMLGNNRDKEWILNRAATELLEEALCYVVEPGLKRDIYQHMRMRVMAAGNESVIINELTGIYRFFRKSIRFGLITARMHLDK